ncbi:hypothetical protein NQ318_000275 [Aromia moschata]|uniref:Peptidase S1 domain-containing protein n=1 Tax=Aromia moschata TaxID=1265417 RepID=A0AAV8YX29_9CUCU|nr:hypothetical protein NQ318_000275 [Aromia moschata]
MLKLVLLLVAVGAALGLPREYSAPGGRIIGGREVDISQYPWTLALLLHYQHYCGAVLIQPGWALTVAHCVDHGLLEGLSVRAGSSSKSIGGEIVDIIEVFLHPEYDPETVDFDFAVCRLASPVQVIDAMPVELPEPGHSPEDGHIAHISGWGQIENEGPTPDILHAAEIFVIPREDCERIYGERITRSMFCAGGGNIDACLGDSGGPVYLNVNLNLQNLNHQVQNLNHQVQNLNHQVQNLNHQVQNLNHQVQNLNHQAQNLNHLVQSPNQAQNLNLYQIPSCILTVL